MKSHHLLFLSSSLFSFFIFSQAQDLQTYIVQLHPRGTMSSLFETKLEWHHSFLEKTVVDDSDSSSRLLYSYDAAIEGFAARLDDDEAEALRRVPGVISVRPDRRLEIHTTYSYKFLGLSLSPGGAWDRSGFRSRGPLSGDSRYRSLPESPSFDDRGMPRPARWRGCVNREISARRIVIGSSSAPSIRRS
ncbi:uncharacterized protein A4U43_C10F18730 [Asparagus officinalis]|uniref:Inhibitor I9 domain-containing protein n=1 Tax=Asparagus officinalis TaxID=4686 RepID=A0A5P1E758_ASPOF|nr:uncharacterized protein A4U43_C10F18730 [Asparagus officinalis]